MKKVQRGFSIEYKSGRRKPEAKSNSIWGNMDLKSIARDVEDATMTRPWSLPQHVRTDDEMSSPETNAPEPLLTPSFGHPTTSQATQEIIMADEIDTKSNADVATAVETPIVPKKQRKPRAKKVALETAPSEVATEAGVVSSRIAGKQKPGRKPRSVETEGGVKRAPIKRGPKTAKTTTVAPPTPIDEMADLLELEAENQKLRKLLAEKLRAENADLRKRLNLG
ncbi:transcriptional regulator [Shinella sp. CPCC 101442]|uniref:transcriptional regulator n=1 Tax=Shinella sp. CPCC 101442 TaxID=2932265 RepID=UPI002153439A|nr:transcriptional regulator [Shinella sp. CPCC 101442]MCR6502058.1 transcriptional regulator [Shinella sp. CPCC 101442]